MKFPGEDPLEEFVPDGPSLLIVACAAAVLVLALGVVWILAWRPW